MNEGIAARAQGVASGRLSALDLIQTALARIAARNGRLQALTDVTVTSALAAAARIDALPPGARAALSLAGIPVVIKDLIDTAGAVCRGGLDLFADYRPAVDALAVARLRAAGAIVVGVGATDRGGMGVRTRTVQHPRIPDRTVGGSSGGAAVAVAADFCDAALGTDTGGSVRIPAACCGVVGFKPTFGRVPVAGVRALVPSLDHVGTLARSVDDVRAIHAVLDPGLVDGAPWASAPRVGVVREAIDVAAREVAAGLRAALEVLTCRGVTLVEVALPADALLDDAHEVIFLYEAARAWAPVMARDGERLPPSLRECFRAGATIADARYAQAMRTRGAVTLALERLFDAVDVLLLPTLPVLAPPVMARTVEFNGHEVGFTSALLTFTRPFNRAGLPALALPIPGAIAALPSSAQWVGPRAGDAGLLAFAARVEGWLAG